MIKKNQKQIDAFQNDSRFKFILAGRRGGKTYLIVESILRSIANAPHGAEVFYIGPNNSHAKEIIWEPLDERLATLGWQYDDFISKSRFELSNKRKIYVIGAEKIKRIRGHKVKDVFLDELAFFETDLNKVWRACRPALSDLKGGAVASTTPDGKGTQAYDWYLEALRKPDWKYFKWSTFDNPWIDQEEIEDAKRELDEKSFNQEYLATWESFEGLAYYNFDEHLHLKAQGGLNRERPIHLCFDFNVNPTTLLLSQKDKDMLRYIKEYSFKHSSTEQTVAAFCEDYKEQKDSMLLKIRGDATGKARSSTTGKTDYYYIEEVLKEYGFAYQKEIPSKNPPIIDRVKIVNGWLKPFKGAPRVEIDPTCTNLIRDLSSQELNGRIPSDANNLGHKADAFGYDIYWQNKQDSHKPMVAVQL